MMKERTSAALTRRAYRVIEVAQLLALSRHSLYRAVLFGRVRAVRMGPRSLRIPAEEVERLMREGLDPGEGQSCEPGPDAQGQGARRDARAAGY